MEIKDFINETKAGAVTDTASKRTPLTDTPPKSLKILAIGNSFSTDSMEYLWQIASDAGIPEVVLGNLYYGGCSMQQHIDFAYGDLPQYVYYKTNDGIWAENKDYKIADAILDEDWDFISLQETSRTCGLTSSYQGTLDKLINYVRSKNGIAKLVWNATWAYQQDSVHPAFVNYDRDQAKMYRMIIDCVKQCVLTEKRIDLVIPCMTSIQNARTSFLGDTLTRDGFHLDFFIGRYIAGLTWYAALTNAPIDGITYNPSSEKITEKMISMATEAVKNAVKSPFSVTPSTFTE